MKISKSVCRLLSVLLTVALTVSALSAGVLTANAETYTNILDGITYVTVYSSSRPQYTYVSRCGTSATGYQSIRTIVHNTEVKSITSYAFCDCRAVTGVGIPGTITSIGEGAFYNCESLTSIALPYDLESISKYTFYDCERLQSVTIRDKVTSIGEGAFYNCKSLTSITLPSGIRSISKDTFYGCENLTSITIPDSVKFIDENAFYYCYNLKNVSYSGNWFMRDQIKVQSGNAYLMNANWKCVSCRETEHVYDSVCDVNCNECGFPRAAHVYTDSCDIECNLCGNIRTISHTYTDNTDELCDVCNFRRYYVSYDPAGGEDGPGSIWVETDSVQLSEHEPVKEGHYFLCWQTAGSDPFQYQPGDTVPLTGSISLSAVWVKNCANCGGSGREEYKDRCADCNGKGTVLSSATCLTCGGDGEYEPTGYVPCTNCDGSGKVLSACVFCAGYGGYFSYTCSKGHSGISKTLPRSCALCGDYDVSWSMHVCGTCGGDGSVDYCTECNGSGQTTSTGSSRICYSCAGTGHPSTDCKYCVGGSITKTRVCSACGGFGVQTAPTPAAPTAERYNCHTVVLQPLENGEYSLDGLTWQSSPVFEGLETGKAYSFYQRYARSDTALTGEASEAASITPDHIYDHACDTGCNSCEYERTITHLYTWVIDKENNCGTDGIKHEECTLCYTKRNENTPIPATGEHTSFDNACDTTCNVCGYVRITGEHVYDNVCDPSCNICGFVRSNAGHAYDHACDATCNNCGYVRAVGGHVYDNVCDNACNICGFTRDNPEHDYDNACDATCNLCGTVRAVGEHVYDDKNDHYCNICNYYALLKYQLHWDDTVRITNFDDNYSGAFVIPKTINGYPVAEISSEAFSGCSGLTSITIPDTVTQIQSFAFNGCDNLTQVHISDLSAWCSITFGYESNPLTIAKKLYLNGNLITDLVIPDDVTAIGNNVFLGYSELTSVEIPASVTSIGSYAFAYCEKLKSISLGEKLSSIGWAAFDSCVGLTDISLPDSLTSIGELAFSHCTGLTSMVIPQNVAQLAVNAIYGCTELTDLHVAQNNATYHSKGNCIIETASKTLILGIKTSTIPSDGSVTVIGNSAFENCAGLKSVVIPNGVTTIQPGAFENCKDLVSVDIPDSVTSIGLQAFGYCTGLTGIALPKGLTTLEPYVFYSCKGLTNISIPKGLVAIGGVAFMSCPIQDVYYSGSEADKALIEIKDGNNSLFYAAWNYNTCETHTYSNPCDGTCNGCSWTRFTSGHTYTDGSDLTCGICGEARYVHGDVNTDRNLDTDDAVYLLLHVMFGQEDYPINTAMKRDINNDGQLTTDDAVYLLLHVMFGAEDYPLSQH